MLASGVDDETIKATLRSISLPEDEITSVLAEAKKSSPQQGQPESEVAEEEGENEEYEAEATEGEEETAGGRGAGSSAGSTAEEDADSEEPVDEGTEEGEEDAGLADEIKGDIEDSHQEQLAHHAETHQILNEHAEKLGAVHSDISSLHDKIDAMPKLSNEAFAGLSALDRRISSLEKAIGEANAGVQALQSLMQKIIETNRQILIEMQRKK